MIHEEVEVMRDYELRQSKGCQMNELEILWRVRMALAEIGWVARLIEAYDNGYSTGQWHMSHLIGTGGDTA